MEVIDVVKQALLITSFVFVMMLVVEYLNVLSSGAWQERLAGHRWGQYVLAAALGATPGCLGAFAVVAMYSHRVVSLGAVVAAMIATCGDEAFVLLAMLPRRGLAILTGLFALGIIAGIFTDLALRGRTTQEPPCETGLEVHADDVCHGFPRGRILHQWRECSPARGTLAVCLLVFALGLLTGQLGPLTWSWVRLTLVVSSLAALFIVSTVPDHFLEDHLWRHVAREHVPRVFLWTLGALVVTHVLIENLQLAEELDRGRWIILGIACLVGVIPESGPHLLFVTLYAQGSVPMSVLLGSSIVQDGHGMLPMLAHSRHAFFGVKLVNLGWGFLVGGTAMALGF